MKIPALPKLTRPGSPGSKPAGKRPLQMPGQLEDLYRDMRDRRLLVPALVLVVAIVAVPIALSAEKEPPPEPLAYAPPEGSEAVAPAVLAEQPVGVRDYRQRLNELKSKSPFASSFDKPGESVADGSLTEPGVTSADPGAAVSGGALPANTDTIEPDNPVGDAASAVPASEVPKTGGGGDDQVAVVAPRIDVRGGPVGERKKVEDVESGDLLPSPRRAPIVMFLGVSENLKYAHFAVSHGVAETEGDGICRPDRRHCEFLRLKDDDKQYFAYGPDGDRYSLKVTDIREEIVGRRKVADE